MLNDSCILYIYQLEDHLKGITVNTNYKHLTSLISGSRNKRANAPNRERPQFTTCGGQKR